MRHICFADGETDQINASWACENDRTLNQILKGEIGFQGYVMSDWGAHHSTLAAVAGLDVRIFSMFFPRGEESVGAYSDNIIARARRCRCRATSRSARARAGSGAT